jgi:very-short-patch-repair endonuclease
MRRYPTPSEAVLARALADGRLGVQFRRQAVVGNRYIADFFAPGKLVVEVDGPIHRSRAVSDARRDRVLRRLGYRVLRLDAELVMKRLPEAIERIRVALRDER